jgi:hypothetical protein
VTFQAATFHEATMTEQEWLACTEPKSMLEVLRGKASDRKLRLFACACCRRVWHLLEDIQSRHTIEVAENYAVPAGAAGAAGGLAAGQAVGYSREQTDVEAIQARA